MDRPVRVPSQSAPPIGLGSRSRRRFLAGVGALGATVLGTRALCGRGTPLDGTPSVGSDPGRAASRTPTGVPAMSTVAWESFLLTTNIASSSGARFAVNRPTTYGGNPVYGSASWTWDRDVDYAYVYSDPAWPASSRYRLLTLCDNGQSALSYAACSAYSADGLTWTKPNLGQQSYAGSTANNLIVPTSTQGHGFYNPTGADAQRWLFLADDGGFHARILAAADPGGPYTLLASLWTNSTQDPHALVQRADGRWLVYYQVGFGSNNRRIGAYLSSSSDLATATWADQGIVIPNGGANDQRYTINTFRHGGLIYGFVSRYRADTDQSDCIRLYASPEADGLAWTLLDSAYLTIGSAGAWDSNYIYQGAPVQVGNEWWHYYSGANTFEHSAPPFNQYLGIATIPYNRIGQVSGAGGTLTTTTFTPAYAHLYVNADASAPGARIDVAVLSGGSPLTGYTKADCDGVTANDAAREVTWGGKILPAGSAIALTVYLTGAAVLYAYQTGSVPRAARWPWA